MSDKLKSKQSDPGQPQLCRIRIMGHLELSWSNWLEGMSVTWEEQGITLLSGQVVDQAALHGLLKKVRDLGLPLISVSWGKPDPDEATEVR